MGTAETQQLTGIAAHIIKRPRLTKILDETEARIILLCAPAGYGKTTLAREWVATRSEPVYWYSGGPAMADVAALAVELAHLISRDTHVDARTRALAARGTSPAKLAELIADSLSESCVVAIDDYHFTQATADAEEFMEVLVARSRARFLIASRVRPRWLAGRPVVYGDVMSLDQNQLAFTVSESLAVLPDAEGAYERARGWPAVIGLAAISGGSKRLAADVPIADMYDFIATDLLGDVDADFRDSLLGLAAGADASPDVAREIFGDQLAKVISDARASGFVTIGESGWIEMHPLLRSFLLGQLKQLARVDRDLIVQTVLRALQAAEEIDPCLALLRTFQDTRTAVELLTSNLVSLLGAGRVATVASWIELARAGGATDAVILLAEAEIALRRGLDVVAESLAEQAACLLDGDLGARAHLTAARAAHQLDRAAAAALNAQKAEELAPDPALRTEALWISFASAYERDPPSMFVAFEKLKNTADSRLEHALRVASAEGFLWFGPGGDLNRSLAAAERAVALAGAVDDALMRTNAIHFHAQILRACGRYDEALEALANLLAEADTSGLNFVVDHALLARAASQIGLRSLDAARRTLREITTRAVANPHIARNTTMLHARLRIAAGDLSAAAVLLEPEPNAPLAIQCEYLSLRALVAAARGDQTGARAALAEAREAVQYEEPRLIAELAQATIAGRQNSDPVAVAHQVRSCIDKGGVDTVITACRAWPGLAELTVRGGEGSALQIALALSRDRDIGRRAGLDMPRELARASALSPRELEVLELIIAGRTNPEIARTLFIGESTAKVHVRHIFEKLGVRSRAEAVAVGAEILRS